MNRWPDERDMEQAVRSWMREDDERSDDRNRQVGRIMGRVDETRQRRGAWRFLPFIRGAQRVDDQDDELFATGRGGLATTRQGVSMSFMAVAAVVALVIVAYAFLALRPSASPVSPGAPVSPSPSPGLTMDPRDVPVIEALAAHLWKGPDSDPAVALEVYADDAVHSVLWLDEEERIEGAVAIRDRMLRSERVDGSDVRDLMRLPDSSTGSRRYFGYRPSFGGTACVFWVDESQITRHDCILPSSFYAPIGAPGSNSETWQPVDDTVALAAVAARTELSTALTEAAAKRDIPALSEIVAPDVVHHVLSLNQAYTVEGFEDWSSINGSYVPTVYAEIDLPAPEGDLRWANFSSVGSGSLCVFWAHDGSITRHDCVVPGMTTVASSLFAAESAAPSSSPSGT